MNMFENIDQLKDIIYDIRDEIDVNHAVIDDRLVQLESKISDISDMLKQLLFEKDHSF